ncbi:MAG: DUF4384 domain-containing protein [Methyloglobulus sp.]|nr:DUF4384 domain-containing protein [Methyloglobulus sp.]
MNYLKVPKNVLSVIGLPFLLVGCSLNPQNADIGLNETLPEAKVTIYQQAIDQLGLMTAVYGSAPLKIMTKDILDNTGTSVATNAEIPRDITEMVKSTLNGIGGNVLYIPYEPLFMQNTAGTGYSDYGDKILPQIILSGGITEFDRGLVTDGDSLDLDFEIGKEYGINFADQVKASLSSVTLDFNLIDFKTFTGIPRIQAINGIKLHKAVREDSIGFTVKSATFGSRGEIKKVQGRHAAVRLLVQLSMLQLIGRYEKIPYWRLIPGAARDEVVIDQVLADYYAMSQKQQIQNTQALLYLHGYSVVPSGRMDTNTQLALQGFAKTQNMNAEVLDQNLYLALYENVPINAATRQRRSSLESGIVNVVNQGNLISGRKPAAKKSRERAQRAETTAQTLVDSGQLTLATNKSEYRIGEKLNVHFSVNKPMYVRVALINSQGKVDTVFPNVYQSNNYCVPGKKYSIPAVGADFSLDISGPVGIDKLRAVASEKPVPAEALFFTKEGQFDASRMASYKVRAAADYVIR